jgi:class 3 adenylate cyclase
MGGVAVDVEYARRGDISIAYQAIGEGPVDIIFGAGLVSHLDLMWADPYATSFLRRLAGIGRLLLFDKPGTGLSDPVIGPPTLSERVDDFLAVLDAVGSRRAIVIGFSEAVAPATLLSATHPDRVEALVALSGFAGATATDVHVPDLEPVIENVMWAALWHSADNWGDGSLAMTISPYMRDNALYRRLAPSVERASASPGMARALIKSMRSYDVTGVVDAVKVPSLVIHRSSEFLRVELGRWLAEHIAGAEMAELPGDEHMCFFGGDDICDAIERFVGGSPAPRASATRKLATVLFADIVESTSTAVGLGDDRWRSVLAKHDQTVVEEVERHGGTLVKTMGDGVLATFDRPLMGVRCALALCRRAGSLDVKVRAGLHTGECEFLDDNDLAGIAVHIGARIAALAGPGEVLVSSTVREIVFGSGVEFESRGEHELKGVPGAWAVHAVVVDRRADQRPAAHATPEQAALTPAPTATMKSIDRALVSVGKRAPRLTRAALRTFSRKP